MEKDKQLHLCSDKEYFSVSGIDQTVNIIFQFFLYFMRKHDYCLSGNFAIQATVRLPGQYDVAGLFTSSNKSYRVVSKS